MDSDLPGPWLVTRLISSNNVCNIYNQASMIGMNLTPLCVDYCELIESTIIIVLSSNEEGILMDLKFLMDFH